MLLKDLQIENISEFYNEKKGHRYLVDENGLELTIQLPFTEVLNEVVRYINSISMLIIPPRGLKEFIHNLFANLYGTEYTKYEKCYDSAFYNDWKFLKVNIYNNYVVFDALLQQHLIDFVSKGDKISLLVKARLGSNNCFYINAEQIIVNIVLPTRRCDFNIVRDTELAQVLKTDSLKNMCFKKLTTEEKESIKELEM